MLGLGCASAGLQPGPAPAMRGQAAEVGAAPWEIPAGDLGTQRLYRVHYDGPRGEGGIRLTLRLQAPDRYQVAATDLLGRSVWSLSVSGEEGLWVDARGETFCRLHGSVELEAVPLSPFTLPSLPAVLLGRLPVAPAAAPPGADRGRLRFRDRQGRRWTVRLADGAVTGWTMEIAGEPAVWWTTTAGESFLSDRRQGVQIRWRQVVQEPLAEPPPPPTVPEAFIERCG